MSRFEDVDFSSFNDTMRELIRQGNEICRFMALSGRRLLEDFFSRRNIEDVTESASQHPLLTVVIITMALSCGLPILLFALFACLTVFLTFTGFLVIEGTLLMIASVFLCGFILAMVFVILSMTSVIALTYFGFVEMFGLNQVNRVQNIAHYALGKSHSSGEQLEARHRVELSQDHED